MALATRNVQRAEAQDIAQAWGNVSGILIWRPRLSKTVLGVDKLKFAVPELFDQTYPVESVRTYLLLNKQEPSYLALKEFAEMTSLERIESIHEPPLQLLVEEPSRLMWDHNGQCGCGHRTYFIDANHSQR